MKIINITIDNETSKVIELPQSFDEMTVKQYIECVPIISEEDTYKRTRMLIDYFTDLGELTDYLKENTIREILITFNYLFEPIDKYTNKIDEFEFNGTIYKVKDKLDDMTFGEKEYVNRIKDIVNEDIYKAIPHLAAVVSIEDGKDIGYKLVELQNKAKLFYNLPCSTAFRLFFSIIGGKKALQNNTENYLKHLNEQITRMSKLG